MTDRHPGWTDAGHAWLDAGAPLSTPAGEGSDVGGHTPTPWAYRPQEYDDWGVIRTTVANADGWHPVVAVARYVGEPSEADLNEHRRNKTDPSYANAAFIVHAVNNHAGLVDALREVQAFLGTVRQAIPDVSAARAVIVAALARSDASEGSGK